MPRAGSALIRVLRLQKKTTAEKMNTAEYPDNLMKTFLRSGREPAKRHGSNRKDEDANVICYKCWIKGHKSRKCYRKVWCSYCKSNTHNESLCKKKGELDSVRKVIEEKNSDKDHVFKVKHTKNKRPPNNVKMKGIMVNGGASSHIVNNIGKFKSFDESFQHETHSVELMGPNARG